MIDFTFYIDTVRNTSGELLANYATFTVVSNSVDGGLSSLDVGTVAIWGTNAYYDMFYRQWDASGQTFGEWTQVDADGNSIDHVSVSPSGSVWAVTTSNYLIHLKGSSNSNPQGRSFYEHSFSSSSSKSKRLGGRPTGHEPFGS